jgi:hypothetical protein
MKFQVVSSFILNVSSLAQNNRMYLRVLGGASLYCLSVAWVSLIGLAPK